MNGFPDTQPGQIDGFPLFSAESLLIDFGIDQVWNSITFVLWDDDDDVTLTLDDGASFNYGPGVVGFLDLGGTEPSSLRVTGTRPVVP